MNRSSIGSRGLLRRLGTGSALLLAVTLLGACSGSEDPADDANGAESSTPQASGLVAIITPSPDDPLVAAGADAAEATAQELGYETSVEVHADDPDRQSELIDAAISQRAVAIILDNAGADASIGPVQKAVDAGIHVFLINHDIDPGGVASAQIVTDDAQGARLGAQSFVEAMGEEGTYVELTGAEADPDAAVRSTSYRGVISRYPDLELVAQETANGDQQQAFARMRAIVTRNPGIDGVIAGNDAMALGAVAALQAANLSDVIVVGFDGSPDAIGAVKEGTMHATVFQPVAQMAELAVEQAHELITTGEATQPERQTIDGELVTRANVDDYGVPGPA